MRGYAQLTQEQRYQIEALHKAGHNQTMTASVLASHKSRVSRELQHNRGCRRYRSKQVPEKAIQRRH
jgi:IS30 family transposase